MSTECTEGDASVVADGGVSDLDLVLAAFEVGPESAALWVGGVTSPSVELVAERLDACERHRISARVTTPSDVVAALMTGLHPSTPYRWRAEYPGGEASPWAYFATAPGAGDCAPVSFLFSADIGPDEEILEQAFSTLDLQPRMFYLNLGDWPYADKAPAASSLEEFRDKHRAARSAPQIRSFLASTPIYAIYDDHDIHDNWDGALTAQSPDLVAAGLQAWAEWFPMQEPVCYRRLGWGRLADIFILDTRRYRSADLAPDDEDKTMLGAWQWAWLERELPRSTAPIIFVVSSVPLTVGVTADDWSGFTADRARLADLFNRVGPDRIIVLSADRHFVAVSHHPNGLREFQVGPLTAGIGGQPEELPAEVVFTAWQRNFGQIELTPGPPVRMVYRCRNLTGDILYEEEVEYLATPPRCE